MDPGAQGWNIFQGEFERAEQVKGQRVVVRLSAFQSLLLSSNVELADKQGSESETVDIEADTEDGKEASQQGESQGTQ